MFISRKKYIELQESLRTLRQNSQIERESTAFWKDTSDNWRMDATHWREKYELSQLTPEVKADTEAAFKRGEESARKKLTAFLIGALQTGTLNES